MADKRKPTRRARPAARAKRTEPRTFGTSMIAAGVAVIGLGAATLAVFLARRSGRANAAEHAAPDLAADRPAPGPHDRAPDAFGPDPTAPVPPELRESLRPATGPAPGFAADRGATLQ